MASIRLPHLTPRVGQDPGASPEVTAPRVIPQQNAQPEQGEQLGQSLQTAGVGALRVGDFLQDQYDDAKATTQKNSFREQVAALEAQAEVLNGKEAVEGIPAIRTKIEELRESYEGRAENDNQHRMFTSFADVRQTDAHIKLDRMERVQTVAFNIGAQKASSEGEIVDYINNWSNPEQGPSHKASALAALNKQGDLEGWSDEQRRLENLTATTKMHTGVLDTLTQSPGNAMSYLAQHKDEMLPAAYAREQQRVQAASDREVAYQTLATPEMAALPLPDKLKALDQQLADKKITLEVHDVARKRAVDDFETADRAKSDYQSSLLNDAMAKIGSNPGVDLNAVLGEKLLTDLKTNNLLDDAETFAADKGLTLKPAGLQRYAALQTDPSELRGVPWSKVQVSLLPIMDLRHIEAVKAMHDTVNGTKKPVDQHLESQERFLFGLAVQAGQAPASTRELKDLSDPDVAKYRSFVERLEQDVNADAARRGRDLTRDEIRGIVKGYSEVQAELGGKTVTQAFTPPGAFLNATVTAQGQRVAIKDVMSDASDPEGARVKPDVQRMVAEWNTVSGAPPLDPNNPAHAALVLASTRAVELERAQKRAPARAEKLAEMRWYEAQATKQRLEVTKDLITRNVPQDDPEWLKVYNPTLWAAVESLPMETVKTNLNALRTAQASGRLEEAVDTLQRRSTELKNPWRR